MLLLLNNLYAYYRNHPISYVDPSGHGAESAADKAKDGNNKSPKEMVDELKKGSGDREENVKALKDLVNETNQKGGVTPSEQKILKEFADEYGVDYDSLGVKGTGKEGSKTSIDIDAIRPQLKTEPDTAFFWSGRTDGVGGADTAANIAKENGGVTLESTIESNNIIMPEWDFNDPSTMEAWDLASGAYAEQVSGEIRAVVGNKLRPGNIWENVELPRLISNPNVTKITTIDPKTRVETIIFER